MDNSDRLNRHRRLLRPERLRAERDERGDVPGWVLITVMTAGLVTLIYTLAESRLQALLTAALSSVT